MIALYVHPSRAGTFRICRRDDGRFVAEHEGRVDGSWHTAREVAALLAGDQVGAFDTAGLGLSGDLSDWTRLAQS